MAESDLPDEAGPISVDTAIEDGRTEISVTGTRDMAIIVNSKAGERIYLPPEAEDEEEDERPYRPAGTYESPYEGVPDESPYGPTRRQEPSVGVSRTANGFRVIHTEPITSMSFIRRG